MSFLYFFERNGDAMGRSTRLESGFQDKLRKELLKRFPGSMVFKMDQVQGIPDILVLYKDKWASFECKRQSSSHKQPNQEYYVNLMNEMSFSRFITRQNINEVLDELSETWGA